MPDDPFDPADWGPIAPRPTPKRETLWSDSNGLTCELLYHGEWGVEAQIFRDGWLLIGRRFDFRWQAVQWAKLEYAECVNIP